MIEGKNGELRLADGTPVRITGDVPLEWTPITSRRPVALWDSIETDVYVDEGATLTSADIDALMDIVHDHYNAPSEIYFYISHRMHWELEYLAQGKHYPSPKKRKSQARMSREWRGRA